MQSHISNKEDNKDISDNDSSIKYEEANETSNTKDINRNAPSNED